MKNKNHIALGIIFGTGLGIILGVALNNTAIGLPIGAEAGVAIGVALSLNSKKCKPKDS